jgi:hypothetical protein
VLSVAYQGSGDRSGPLAWGQQALWNACQRTRPEDRYFNFSRDFTVPPEHAFDVDRVGGALSRVLGRHEALRTTLLADEPRPVQVVRSAGRLDVEVRRCAPDDVDAVVAATMAEYEARTFDYVGELPLRVAFVVTDDTRLGGAARVVQVVFCFCHLAADFNASQVVLDDFARYLLEGGVGLPDAPQPLDLVAVQRGPVGQRASERALAYWEAEYRRIPPTMFPVPRAVAQEPPFWTGAISSAALGKAVTLVAARYELSSSAVVLAACAGMAAELAGRDVCAMLAIVANRFRPAQRQLVSSLSMEGLLVVEIDRGATFAALARRTGRSALARTYRFAEYDETARDAMFARVNKDRGQTVHPYCCYNDLRGEPERGADSGAAPDLAALSSAMSRTEFGWTRKLPKVRCRFCLHIIGGAPLFRADLTADTRYLPPDTIERYLHGVERLLVESAARDVPLGELSEMLR